jgi:hypothetical protein
MPMLDITAIWQAAWYELDQPIRLGLKDIFILIENAGVLRFCTGFASEKEIKEIEGEILKISHRALGEISEIDTSGLTYRIKLISGKEIVLEAEETPGRIENDYPQFDHDNWRFEVIIRPKRIK